MRPADSRAIAAAAARIHAARELERRRQLEAADFHARVAESVVNRSAKMKRFLRRAGCRA